MDAALADKLSRAAAAMAVDMQVRKYSGRGMFGVETIAIDCDSVRDFWKVVTYAAVMVGRDAPHEIDDFMLNVDEFRQDSLGKGYIFY